MGAAAEFPSGFYPAAVTSLIISVRPPCSGKPALSIGMVGGGRGHREEAEAEEDVGRHEQEEYDEIDAVIEALVSEEEGEDADIFGDFPEEPQTALLRDIENTGHVQGRESQQKLFLKQTKLFLVTWVKHSSFSIFAQLAVSSG